MWIGCNPIDTKFSEIIETKLKSIAWLNDNPKQIQFSMNTKSNIEKLICFHFTIKCQSMSNTRENGIKYRFIQL